MKIKERLANPSNLVLAGILLFITILFFIGLFIKPAPFVYIDSYSYLNYIQGTVNEIPLNTPIIGELIINLLPTNEFYLQLILMIVAFISAYILAKIGQLLNKHYGWLAGVMIFFGIYSSMIFYKLETDVFAIPFILLSIYYIFKYNMSHKSYWLNRHIIASVICIIIAGLIWTFSIYFVPILIILSNYHLYYFAVFLPAIYYIRDFITGLVPMLFTGTQNFVMEQLIVIGVLDILFLGFVFSKKYRNELLETPFWVSVGLAFVNLKMAIILLIITALTISSKIKQVSQKDIIYGIMFLLIIIGVTTYTIYQSVPNQENTKVITEFEAMDSNSVLKKVNWNQGYYYTYLTGKHTEHYGGYSRRIEDYSNTLAITFPEDIILQDYNCDILKEYETDIIVRCD